MKKKKTKQKHQKPVCSRIPYNFGALFFICWQFHLRKSVTCDISLFDSNNEFLLND